MSLEKATLVVERLRENGFAAVLAGGCVRDQLLDREPKDYDIATSATPDEVEGIFFDTLAIGKAFGVIQVKVEGEDFEVATFRSDQGSTDGRHPDSVRFCGMEEDAARRDFTINAMFYDPINSEVIDFFGGKNDLHDKIIKFVGNPYARIKEDYLRMLRALRFYVTLPNFKLDHGASFAIMSERENIRRVSQERITSELRKMFSAKPHLALECINASGLTGYLLPEVAVLHGCEQHPEYHPEGDVFKHTQLCLEHVPVHNEEVVWAVLLHDIGKPATQCETRSGIHFYEHHERGAAFAKDMLYRMKFPSKFIEKVCWLVKNHMRPHFGTEMRKSTVRKLIAHEWYEDLMAVHWADIKGSDNDKRSYERIRLIEKTSEPELIKPPRLIGGNDLITMGLRPGPQFAEIIKHVQDLQREGTVKTREEALDAATRYHEAKQ